MQASADFQQRRVRQFRNGPDVETALVREFFGGRPGYYVDVGANDPVVDSQTWHLEALGWTGLLIEPDPDCARRLREQRRGTVVEAACSSPENAGRELLLHRAGPHSTLEAQPIARGAVAQETVAVRCDTLDAILRAHGAAPGFDFLSVDIEGHELVALSGFDFGYWQPSLVLLEDHVTGLAKHGLLVAKGYTLLMRTGLNSWYVPKDPPWQLSLGARFEFFRKYYLGLPLRKLRYTR
jgi:FkbM family methyltransferase